MIGFSADDVVSLLKGMPKAKPVDLEPCEECGKLFETGYDCRECCEHGDICLDDRVCLSCGIDLSEELACRAEYYADMKADR